MMMFLDNHVRIEFDPRQSTANQLPDFSLSAQWPKRRPESPFKEAVRCAKNIGENHSSLKLCLSGGMDSEAMALAFLEAGIPFSVAIMKLSENLNHYDIEHAVDFCDEHQVNYEFVEIDPFTFLEKDLHLQYDKEFLTLSPERSIHLHFLEKVTGVPVIAGQPLQIHKVTAHPTVNSRDARYWYFHRYLKESNRFGIPDFHFYSPEFLLSFMFRQKEVLDFSGTSPVFSERAFQSKRNSYVEGGFPLRERAARVAKWHGFEGLRDEINRRYGDCYFQKNYREPMHRESGAIRFSFSGKTLQAPTTDLIEKVLFQRNLKLKEIMKNDQRSG
ncbi:MAG: hypothetical protein CL677_01045 [Bdellovibrionaceae bacterium]|nr:hypothetical protein [Pseudobdellovibrionaceae bacterium]|tara:strand:+ start:130155 stop:131144 length:990 start_codon:yes stop_codon:yes gene_type:complete